MIYWDHNSTTPCAPEVIEAMRPYWNEDFGNPASSHLMGRRAAAAVSKARQQVATLANALPEEIVFTSGASESNNLLFLGILLTPLQERRQIVVSAIEHKSVLEPARLLRERGFELIELPVDKNGVVDMKEADRLITEQCLLVSVQAANNEIGTIQPIAELACLAHDKGAYFHSDAAQALGRIPFDVLKINCDFASFSAHKLYGPKGIGALFVRGGARRWPWAKPFRGGGQEADLRPGTHNVPAIVGFGEACKIAQSCIDEEHYADCLQLDSEIKKAILAAFPNVVIHADTSLRVPGVVSIAFPQINADIILDSLDKVMISRGSACSSHSISTSHVLVSIGCTPEDAKSTLRISIGRNTTITDVQDGLKALRKSITMLSNIIN